MSKNNLFLTSSEADKKSYIEMMEATVNAVASAMDHPHAYAGMGPYELREAVHTDELLPAKGCGFDAVLEDIKAKILPNLVRPMSTNYMAHLHSAVLLAETLPRWMVILFIYLIVLVMNFFISSGSAKAFLLMPLIVPAAQVFGISAQLCVAAFAFGDGFSNVFYPTNAALLIALGLTGTPYSQWIKFTWKFQVTNLLLTSLLLLFGLIVGYC